MKKHIITFFALLFLQLSLFSQSPQSQNSIVRILAIGNSFSEDGIEHYLHDLANADNKKIIIGNMYIGGAPLSLHLKQSKTGSARYSYRRSEEHTSELQSLMRISYAVFCLKKKTKMYINPPYLHSSYIT